MSRNLLAGPRDPPVSASPASGGRRDAVARRPVDRFPHPRGTRTASSLAAQWESYGSRQSVERKALNVMVVGSNPTMTNTQQHLLNVLRKISSRLHTIPWFDVGNRLI
uniref:Uncharacterized protein n=1 Tax=Oryza brachyantha TaxID=4533 RepID=J3MM72_ORYBR